MKILFVEPVIVPNARKIRNKILAKMYTSNSLTFQILASVTPEKHTIRLMDERFEEINYDEDCDIVGITCTTYYAPRAYDIADGFKNRGKTVVMGGHHPTAMPEESKQHADAVVIGEAEETWPQLLEDFENGALKPYYRQEKPVDLNSIPFPRRDIVKKNLLVARVQATKGCTYGCKFCCIPNIEGSYLRKRAIDKVIEEIKTIPQKFLIFSDPSLTIDVEYTKELFRHMKSLKKKFSCCGNVDVLGSDDELLVLAKKAGCIAWQIGFETFSQEALDSIGKTKNRVEKYKHIVEKIHKYKMAVVGSFIVGFDEDTKESLGKFAKQVEDLHVNVIEFSILTPFPGTSLFDQMEKEGRITNRDWEKYAEGNRGDIVFEPKNMTEEELRELAMGNIFRRTMTSRHAALLNLRRMPENLKLGIYPCAWSVFHRSLWV